MSEKTKYGTSVSCRYRLVWAHRGVLYSWLMPSECSPKRLGDGATPQRVIRWALDKFDALHGEAALGENIVFVGHGKEYSDRERLAGLGAWRSMREKIRGKKRYTVIASPTTEAA